MNIMDGVGLVGSLFLAFCGLPQALKSIRDGHSRGLSKGFVWMWFWGEILTVIYVYLKHGFDIPLFTNYTMNIIIILVIIKYKYFPIGKNLLSWGLISVFFFSPLMAAEKPMVDGVPLEIVEMQQSIIDNYHLSVGQKVVQEWKEITTSPTKPQKLSGAEKVDFLRQQKKAQLASSKRNFPNKQNMADTNNIWAKQMAQHEEWMGEKSEQITEWIQQREETIKRWQQEHEKFRLRISQYVKTVTALDDLVENAKRKEKPITSYFQNRFVKQVHQIPLPIFPNTFYVDQAFVPAIKDQGTRPTCAAFAAIRAVEILAAQQGVNAIFSEQYFYWASRPDCQQQPCQKRGSWALTGLLRSQNSSHLDLPLANQCPYQPVDIVDNQTQLPLPSGCLQGQAKIKNFSSTKDLVQVINALKNNHPVMGAFFLSDSFYQNNGYVFMDNKSSGANLDEHAAGHVLLIIGHMSLPPSLAKTEGKYCLMVANSWGEGFGKGGYCCISEKWLSKYHYSKAPFLILEEIEVVS